MQLFVPIFFFQAEDGIRDLTVTGVQTCALPIFRRAVRSARSRPRRARPGGRHALCRQSAARAEPRGAGRGNLGSHARSEERRPHRDAAPPRRPLLADPHDRPRAGRAPDARERHAVASRQRSPARFHLRRLAHPLGRPAARGAPRATAARRARRGRADRARLPPRRRTVAPQRRRSVTYRHLLVDRSADRHVVTVILNRPEQMNAMNTAMGEDLLACFDGLKMDTDARAVVFTGAGDRAFCAGGDLKERNEMSDETWRAQHVIFEQAAFRVLRCPIPIIAAVEGFALAGGCELAILSDFIVASETAVFGVPETTL